MLVRQPEGPTGRRESRLQRAVWGGGNEQDWGASRLDRAKPAAARALHTQLTLGREWQGELLSGRTDDAERVAEGCPEGEAGTGEGVEQMRPPL